MFSKEKICVFVEQVRSNVTQNMLVGVFQMYKDVTVSEEFYFLP